MKVISTISTLFLFIMLSLFSTSGFSDDNQPASPQSVININSASAQQISAALKGIGLKKAQAIVDYRESYGSFAHVEEVMAVKGIGKNTLEKNVHLIALE